MVGQYTGDFAFAILLAGLGIFSEVKTLIKGDDKDSKKEESTTDDKTEAVKK